MLDNVRKENLQQKKTSLETAVLFIHNFIHKDFFMCKSGT